MGEFTLQSLEMDKTLGFMPRLGEDSEYGLYGCLHNDYQEKKRPGTQRLLFVGDSVTHRGKIIRALQALYGDEKFEYWNAGVESFNTEQEAGLYERHNHECAPDQVILTFHNNDFMATPITFENDGKMEIFSPRHHQSMSPWLFKNSSLYRLWLRISLSGVQQESVESVKKNLSKLKNLVEADQAKFSVILFPILKPYSEWSKREKDSREQTLKILEELNIDFYDPWDELSAAIESGVDLQEGENDHWHPNEKAAEIIAEHVKSRGIIESGGR